MPPIESGVHQISLIGLRLGVLRRRVTDYFSFKIPLRSVCHGAFTKPGRLSRYSKPFTSLFLKFEFAVVSEDFDAVAGFELADKQFGGEWIEK